MRLQCLFFFFCSKSSRNTSRRRCVSDCTTVNLSFFLFFFFFFFLSLAFDCTRPPIFRGFSFFRGNHILSHSEIYTFLYFFFFLIINLKIFLRKHENLIDRRSREPKMFAVTGGDGRMLKVRFGICLSDTVSFRENRGQPTTALRRARRIY